MFGSKCRNCGGDVGCDRAQHVCREPNTPASCGCKDRLAALESRFARTNAGLLGLCAGCLAPLDVSDTSCVSEGYEGLCDNCKGAKYCSDNCKPNDPAKGCLEPQPHGLKFRPASQWVAEKIGNIQDRLVSVEMWRGELRGKVSDIFEKYVMQGRPPVCCGSCGLAYYEDLVAHVCPFRLEKRVEKLEAPCLDANIDAANVRAFKSLYETACAGLEKVTKERDELQTLAAGLDSEKSTLAAQLAAAREEVADLKSQLGCTREPLIRLCHDAATSGGKPCERPEMCLEEKCSAGRPDVEIVRLKSSLATANARIAEVEAENALWSEENTILRAKGFKEALLLNLLTILTDGQYSMRCPAAGCRRCSALDEVDRLTGRKRPSPPIFGDEAAHVTILGADSQPAPTPPPGELTEVRLHRLAETILDRLGTKFEQVLPGQRVVGWCGTIQPMATAEDAVVTAVKDALSERVCQHGTTVSRRMSCATCSAMASYEQEFAVPSTPPAPEVKS